MKNNFFIPTFLVGLLIFVGASASAAEVKLGSPDDVTLHDVPLRRLPTKVVKLLR